MLESRSFRRFAPRRASNALQRVRMQCCVTSECCTLLLRGHACADLIKLQTLTLCKLQTSAL